MNSNEVQLDHVIKTPPQENHSPTAQPITDRETESLASNSGQVEESIPLVSPSSQVQEEATSGLGPQGYRLEKSDSLLDDVGDDIEPEWTILDADELTQEYPERVRLCDHDQDSDTGWPRPNASGSWELLYNMAAAEVDQTAVGEELTTEDADQHDGDPQEVLQENEEDDLEPGKVYSMIQIIL